MIIVSRVRFQSLECVGTWGNYLISASGRLVIATGSLLTTRALSSRSKFQVAATDNMVACHYNLYLTTVLRIKEIVDNWSLEVFKYLRYYKT